MVIIGSQIRDSKREVVLVRINSKTLSPSSLEIRLLGPFRIVVDGTSVDEGNWSRRKPQLLLKLLALQPHHQLHREEAMELLWPEHEPESASNNLHKAIHLARRALEPELHTAADSHFIVKQGQQIVLRAPDRLWVDVEAFEHAAAEAMKGDDAEVYTAALTLYSGDLLAEDLYEDWAATRREQLRSTYQELLLRLAWLYETRGQYQHSIERFKELVARDQSNEEAHRQLMRLYTLTGNKHQALRQYQLCCDALGKELDAEPDRATQQLHRQIISGQLAPPAREVGRDPGSGETIETIDSLAILPLANASSDPNAEYLSDGITESIINSLSQLPQLKVMARSTVFRYKGKEVEAQQVGRELSVRAVLMGRVLAIGDQLVIGAELVDTRDGSQLWGEQYNRNLADIFAVQEQISKEITHKLRLRLSGADKGRLTKRHTENTEAYRLFLKGRYFWNKRTAETVEKGIEYFQRAIDTDPNYALAYVGLADAYAKLGDVGVAAMPPRIAFSKAKTAVLKALRIDSELAEAHNSLAHLHMHDYEWSEAGREFSHAIELNPNYAPTYHWHAFHLSMVGRPDEAMMQVARALELDPLSLPINAGYGELLYFARQYDQAIEQLEKTLEMDPHFYPAHIDLGRVYEEKRMYEEAISEFRTALELSGSTDGLAALGHAYAVSGRRKEALDILTQLSDLSKSRYVSPYGMAVVYVGLGENGRALEWLQMAAEEHAGWVIYLNIDPKLDPLREEAKFEDLLRNVGLAPYASKRRRE